MNGKSCRQGRQENVETPQDSEGTGSEVFPPAANDFLQQLDQFPKMKEDVYNDAANTNKIEIYSDDKYKK